jgi:hypothetical protein
MSRLPSDRCRKRNDPGADLTRWRCLAAGDWSEVLTGWRLRSEEADDSIEEDHPMMTPTQFAGRERAVGCDVGNRQMVFLGCVGIRNSPECPGIHDGTLQGQMGR